MGLIKMDWLEGVRRCRQPRAIVLVRRRRRRRRRQGNICVTLDISRQCDEINQWTTLLTYHYFDTEIKCSFFVFSLSSTTDVSKLVSHVACRGIEVWEHFKAPQKLKIAILIMKSEYVPKENYSAPNESRSWRCHSHLCS